MSLKNPMTPSGIEPATFRVVHTWARSEKLSRAFSNGKLCQAKDSQLETWDNYKLNIVFHLLMMVLDFISALN
jgi:hypothetical protein